MCPFGGWPNTLILPVCGGRSPAIAFRSVRPVRAGDRESLPFLNLE